MLGEGKWLSRLHLADLHCRTDLATAAAGIGGVDEAADALHIAAQRLASASETLAKCVGRNIQYRRPLLTAHLEHLAQNISHPLLPIQAQQHPLRALQFHLAHQQRLIRTRLARLSRSNSQPGIDALRQLLKALRMLAGTLLARRQQVVHSDAIGPGRKRTLAAKRRKAGYDLQQNLLHRILRILWMAQHP